VKIHYPIISDLHRKQTFQSKFNRATFKRCKTLTFLSKFWVSSVVEEPFSKWGHKRKSKKLWKIFFIKRLTLTMDPIRTSLSKCGVRLETFLRGPTQCVQKFLMDSIKSYWQKLVMYKTEARETSSESGIHLISDINDFKMKSRKWPRSLSLASIHSSDWNEYRETKTSQIMNNGLTNKRIKIEQFGDWDYFSILTGFYWVKIDLI